MKNVARLVVPIAALAAGTIATRSGHEVVAALFGIAAIVAIITLWK